MIECQAGKLSNKGRPLVVLDRSVLLQKIQDFVPRDAEYVIPDVVFREIATGENPQLEGVKFNGWAKCYAERVWISRYWDEMSRDFDKSPDSLARAEDIVNGEVTRKFRNAAKDGGLFWNIDLEEDMRSRESERKEFLSLCQDFGDWVKQNQPDCIKEYGDESKRLEWIQRPDQVVEFVRVRNPRFCDLEWSAVLGQFPDQLAVCRYYRLMVWYAFLYSLGRTKDFLNNWEDMEYAFAASYIGRIATADEGLKSAVRAVFPGCVIFPDALKNDSI